MVCLGVELAAQAWLEAYNRLRKVSDPDRIDYIELRTDPMVRQVLWYGKFFEHKAASAQVTVTQDGKTGHIKIENFVSPPFWSAWHRRRAFFRPTLTIGGRWWTAC